jgi:hypothetical protein
MALDSTTKLLVILGRRRDALRVFVRKACTLRHHYVINAQ